jgi:putative ABC transport system permease protein
MSDIKLALTYLRARLLITLLTVLSVVLGIGLATIVLVLSQQATRTLRDETAQWDVVIGAKGSPLQLVLNGLYYLDAPTGNIDGELWEALEHDPAVTRVVPLNMGDNYMGAPFIGTTHEFFDDRGASVEALVAKGRLFAQPFEAVVGADIAARHGIALEQELIGSHGWSAGGEAHGDLPYTVVGILAPTGTSLDRAIFTDYRSVWLVHADHDHDHEADPEAHAVHDEHEEAAYDEHAAGHDHEEHAGHEHEEHAEHAHDDHDHEAAAVGHEEHDDHDAHAGHDHAQIDGQVTTLLVKFAQTGRRYQFAEFVNRQWNALAVIPVDEIDKVERTFIAPLQGILLVVAYLVVLVSALSILISLYLTIHQRRRDLAIMRSLGATRGDVFRLITLEAAMLSGIGVATGWVLGHGLLALLSPISLARIGVSLQAWVIHPAEFAIALSVWALGILAGLLPAIVAYRMPVAETLVRE